MSAKSQAHVRKDKMRYYIRSIVRGKGHPFLIEMIEKEYPYRTAHMRVARKVQLVVSTTIKDVRRQHESRKAQLAYYKRHLLYNCGDEHRIEQIEKEYPLETAHLQFGVWIRRKLKLL